MEKIHSRYLEREFTFTPATMQRNDGPVTIIPHNELWDIIHNQIKDKSVTYDYNPVAVTKEHCFIGCTIQDTSGRIVTEFGESTADTLVSKIAKGIPATMAQIRAFDRAAIRYLDFACDGKVYSDNEIPSSEYAAAPSQKEKKAKTDEQKPPVIDPTLKPKAVDEPAVVEETSPASNPEQETVAEEVPDLPPEPPRDKPLEKAPATWKNGNVKQTVLDAVAENSEAIFFDTETSGLKPAEDRILEISAKKYTIENGQFGGLIDELHTYIKPPFSVNPKITELNGISDELLSDKPVEEDAFVDIFNFFGETPQIIGAYNEPFDYNFMSALYKRQEKVFTPGCRLDVLDMARDLVKDVPNHKLQTVSEHFGIKGDDYHTAGFDTDCAVDLFKRFLQSYTESAAAPADETTSGGIKPAITSITLFDKSATLRRIYVNTDSGTLYYDLVKKSWASKDAKIETFDMNYVEKEAWKCVDAADQAAFEQFKGNWSAEA